MVNGQLLLAVVKLASEKSLKEKIRIFYVLSLQVILLKFNEASPHLLTFKQGVRILYLEQQLQINFVNVD